MSLVDEEAIMDIVLKGFIIEMFINVCRLT